MEKKLFFWESLLPIIVFFSCFSLAFSLIYFLNLKSVTETPFKSSTRSTELFSQKNRHFPIFLSALEKPSTHQHPSCLQFFDDLTSPSSILTEEQDFLFDNPSELNAWKDKEAHSTQRIQFVLKKITDLRKKLESLSVEKKQVTDLTQLVVKTLKKNTMQNLRVWLDAEKEDGVTGITELKIQISSTHVLLVSKNDENDTYEGSLQPILLKKQMRRVAGFVNTSLYKALKEQHVPAKTIREVIKAYSYVVNLQHGLKQQSPFEILYEALVDSNGLPVEGLGVRYVSLASNGKEYKLYCLPTSHSKGAYYTQNGESVVRSFLQTPIDPSKMKITSHFQKGRMHPLKGYRRDHKGVDFGAPIGTNVMAAASGVVVQASYQGDYGKIIRIKHAGHYETGYAHLSRIANKIKPGYRVQQGEIIGHVGKTGLTSGPHLHHELKYQNAHINPLSVKQIPSIRLGGNDFKKFEFYKRQVHARIVGLKRMIASHTRNIR